MNKFSCIFSTKFELYTYSIFDRFLNDVFDFEHFLERKVFKIRTFIFFLGVIYGGIDVCLKHSPPRKFTLIKAIAKTRK